MSKKKNRKIILPKNRSDSELLELAKQAEIACKFKEAFGNYKELNKRYPGKYDETLIRIQIARVEAFLREGAIKSAREMLTGLKGQIPGEALKSLELRMAIKQDSQGAAADRAWEALKDPASLDPGSRKILMESLVFSGSNPSDNDLLENRDVQTILAVREGFVALCEGNREALSQALAKIPLSSPLAHWKLLLRSLEAWYSSDQDLLEKCLPKLSDIEGKGAKVVQGLKLLHDRDHPVTSESVESVFGIHGLYDFADDLIEIDQHIQRGKPRNAFKFAKKKYPRFLNQESVKDHILAEGFTRLYEHTFSNGDYRTFIDSLIVDKRTPVSSRLPFMRVNYKLGGKVLDCNCHLCVAEQGEAYLNALEGNGISQKESAYIKYHLANRLMEQINTKDKYAIEETLEECIALLEEAFDEDPKMVKAGLLLAKCYLDSQNTSEGNALLDELAQTFPEEPAVLLAAGRRCIERKTYVRGLKHLEQAYSINPHLEGLRDQYVEGLLNYALQCYKKGLLDKGRDCFERMSPHLKECSGDAEFGLGSRWMHLRQLEMETTYGGDPERLKSQVDQEWAGQETLRKLLACLIMERFGNAKRIRRSYEELKNLLADKSLIKELEPQDVCALLAFMKHSSGVRKVYTNLEIQFMNFIRDYSKYYVKERLESILKLFWALIPDYIIPQEVLKLTKIWSKADRRHPQIKVMHLLALESHGEPPDELLPKLDEALANARTRGDEVALREGNKLRKRLEEVRHYGHANPMPNFDDSYEDDFHDDAYNDDPDLIFEKIFSQWKNLNPRERKAMEKEIEKRLNKPAARALIKIFEQRMADEMRGKAQPQNYKKTNTTNPNQMNFNFDQ